MFLGVESWLLLFDFLFLISHSCFVYYWFLVFDYWFWFQSFDYLLFVCWFVLFLIFVILICPCRCVLLVFLVVDCWFVMFVCWSLILNFWYSIFESVFFIVDVCFFDFCVLVLGVRLVLFDFFQWLCSIFYFVIFDHWSFGFGFWFLIVD